jgi:spore germination protein KA
MGLIFEVIREGGIRLPKPIGQAISIMGALVIGQATVQAGLVAAPTVIVVAVTAVTSFVIPTLQDEVTPLRVIMVILAGVLGAFGIVIGLLALLIHLVSLRSFGVPYLSPIAPENRRDLFQDVLIRAPWWAMFQRPSSLVKNNLKRQEFWQMPHASNRSNNGDENQ